MSSLSLSPLMNMIMGMGSRTPPGEWPEEAVPGKNRSRAELRRAGEARPSSTTPRAMLATGRQNRAREWMKRGASVLATPSRKSSRHRGSRQGRLHRRGVGGQQE
jgi:hypothetical protein